MAGGLAWGLAGLGSMVATACGPTLGSESMDVWPSGGTGKLVKNGPNEAVLALFGTHPIGVGIHATPTGCGFKGFFVKSHKTVNWRQNPLQNAVF
jgi:hypothetical protein